MALRLQIDNTSIGVNFPLAYAKISGFTGDKNTIKIMVDVFANEDARNRRAQVITGYMFEMPFTEITGELFPSMYQWLKLQPIFSNAENC